MRKTKETIKILEQLKAAIERADEALANSAETRDLVTDLAGRVKGRERTRAVLAPPILPQWGERPLTMNERNAVETLINYQAERTGLSPRDVEAALESFFGVVEEGFPQLKGWEYDGIVRFLVDFEPTSLPAADNAEASQ